MRKSLLLSILILWIGNVVFAQDHNDPWIWPDDNTTDVLTFRLEVGPKLSGGMTHATTPTRFDMGFRNGFTYQAGIVVNASLAHRLSETPQGISRLGLGVEALLSEKNIRTRGESLSILCFDIPILLRFFLNSNLSLEAGTTLVMPIKVEPQTIQTQDVILYTGEMKPADAMFTIGANYKVSSFTVGCRCNLGTSIMARNLDSSVQTFMLSLGYLFPF